MNRVIKYTSQNGYTGVLYGERSYAVFDKSGREVIHTGSRNINTYEELRDDVETLPEFMDSLATWAR